MGIYKLMEVLKDKAPGCIKRYNLDYFSGKIVACDASMAMY